MKGYLAVMYLGLLGAEWFVQLQRTAVVRCWKETCDRQCSLVKIMPTGRFGIIQEQFPSFSPSSCFLLLPVLLTSVFASTASTYVTVQLLKLCKPFSLNHFLNTARSFNYSISPALWFWPETISNDEEKNTLV